MSDIDNLLDESLSNKKSKQPAQDAGFSSGALGIDDLDKLLPKVDTQPLGLDEVLAPPASITAPAPQPSTVMPVQVQNKADTVSTDINAFIPQNLPIQAPNTPVTPLSQDLGALPITDINNVPQDPVLRSLSMDKELPEAEWSEIDLTLGTMGATNKGTGGVIQMVGRTTPGSWLSGMYNAIGDTAPAFTLTAELLSYGMNKLVGNKEKAKEAKTLAELSSLRLARDVLPVRDEATEELLDTAIHLKSQEATTQTTKTIDAPIGLERAADYTNALIEIGETLSDAGDWQLEQAIPQDKKMTFMQDVVFTGTTSFAQMVPGLAAGLVLRNPSGKMNLMPAISLPTSLAVGTAFDEAKSEGLSDANAFVHASITGGIEYYTEKWGLGALDDLTAPMFKTLKRTLLRETSSEIAATFAGELETAYALNKDLTGRELMYRMAVAAVSAAGTSVAISAPVVAAQKHSFNKLEMSADELNMLGIDSRNLVEKLSDGVYKQATEEKFTNGKLVKRRFYDTSDLNITDVRNIDSRIVIAQKALDAGHIDKNIYNKIIAEEAQVFKYLKELSPTLELDSIQGIHGSEKTIIFEDKALKRLTVEEIRNRAQEKFNAYIEDTAGVFTLLSQDYNENNRQRRELLLKHDKILQELIDEMNAQDTSTMTPIELIQMENAKKILQGTLNEKNIPGYERFVVDKTSTFKGEDLIEQYQQQTGQDFSLPGVYVIPDERKNSKRGKNKPLTDTEQNFVKMLTHFQKKYFPDLTVFFSREQPSHPDAGGEATSFDGKVVRMRLDAKYYDYRTGKLFDTAVHELGHAFHRLYFESLPESMKRNVLRELVAEIQKNNISLDNHLFKTSAKALDRTGYINSDLISDYRTYYMTLHELFARGMINSLNNKNTKAYALRNYALDMEEILKDLAKYTKWSRDGIAEYVPNLVMLTDALELRRLEVDYMRIKNKLQRAFDKRDARGEFEYDTETGGWGGVFDTLPPEVRDAVPENAGFLMDNFSWLQAKTVNLTQIIKDHSHIPQMSEIGELARLMHQETNGWQMQANERIREWESLGKGMSDRLAKMLYEYTTKYKDKPSDAVLQTMAEFHGLDATAMRIFNGIVTDMNMVIDAMKEQAMIPYRKKLQEGIARGEDIEELLTEAEETAEVFNKLARQAFFPLSRFGTHSIAMYANSKVVYQGKTYRAGQVIRFETYEGKYAAAQAHETIKKQHKALIRNGKVRIQKSVLSEEEQVFVSMPAHFVKALGNKLNLSANQTKNLDKFLREMAPAQSFTKHFNKRKGLHGYSADAIRTYADYMARFSRHISKVKYGDKILESIHGMQSDLVQGAKMYPDVDTSRRQNLINYMKRWHNYMMAPENEWAKLRSFGFFYYLAFVPKSAALNLSQIGLTAWPALAAEFGDAKATRELAKAMRLSIGKWKRGELPQNIQNAVDWGIQAGFLDESDASILAGAASGGVLDRFIPNNKATKFAKEGLKLGTFLFHMTETFGRRSTFIAAYNLALKRGASDAEARVIARGMVDDTMFEYARWARPELLRGKKGALFLFHQFSLGMTKFMFNGNKGWWRSWLVLAAVAGLQGLPFAENIMDILDWLYKKAFGTHSDIRTEARRYIQEAGANPDLIMHGASRYSTGYFNDMLGLDLPYLDLSGSLSMGKPFSLVNATIEAGTGNKSLPDAFAEGGGALVSIPFSVYNAVYDKSVDKMYRVGKALPTFAKNVWMAGLAANRGGYPDKNGYTLAHIDLTNPTQVAEVLMFAQGFMPTRRSQAYELLIAQNKQAMFWQAKRVNIINAISLAVRLQDRELLKDSMKAMADFNKNQPYGGFTINSKTIKASLKNGFYKQALKDAGLGTQEKLMPLYIDMLNAYPQLKYRVEGKAPDNQDVQNN